MSGRGVQLGYTFTPVPNWIFDAFSEGDLTELRYRILSFLFRFASSDKLAAREVTPTLSLDKLADALRWESDLRSLQKRLSEIRKAGLFGYRVTGSPATGYRYAFTLYPDGPPASDHRPTIECEEERGISDWPDKKSEAARPTTVASRPTIEERAKQLYNSEFTDARGASRPTSQDVREKANPRPGEDQLGKASRDHHDHVVGEDTGEADVADTPRTDRLFEYLAENGHAERTDPELLAAMRRGPSRRRGGKTR